MGGEKKKIDFGIQTFCFSLIPKCGNKANVYKNDSKPKLNIKTLGSENPIGASLNKWQNQGPSLIRYSSLNFVDETFSSLQAYELGCKT